MKHVIQVTIISSFFLLLASCGADKEPGKTERKPAATDYKTMELLPRKISGNVQLPGVMQPYEFVQLFPKISGFVKNVSVDRGSIVRKGQVLIILEAPETEQLAAQAMLKFTQAQAAYVTSRDRYRRMLETSKTPGTISPYDLEAAASKMQGDSATSQGEYANYKAQEALKAYLTVTAPFDGVITERNVHPGALVGPGTQNVKPMLVLQQLSMLRLVVDVPEQYAAQVHEGDKVHYKTNSMPGQDLSGSVSRSSQSLNNNYRSETIEIDVKNMDNLFKSGMYAEVVLPISGAANAFVVPRSAVVTTTEKRYVVVAENGIARLRSVSEGNQTADSTEIFGELHEHDMVVTNATYQLKEGVAIR